jgi:hypothetical protein
LIAKDVVEIPNEEAAKKYTEACKVAQMLGTFLHEKQSSKAQPYQLRSSATLFEAQYERIRGFLPSRQAVTEIPSPTCFEIELQQ